MTRILLVSMPYTVLTMPSIAIAQLKGVAEARFGAAVQVDTAHCFIDFAEFTGLENYQLLGNFEGKGLHDWLFRQEAFDVPDNRSQYEEFFFCDGRFPRKRRIFELVSELRPRVGEFLEKLIERYRMTDYDVVGMTSMMSQNISSYALARRLKRHRPELITLLGGPNCEYPMGPAIAEHIDVVDYVFSGEALVSFPAFIEALARRDFAAIAAIRGVHTRHREPARRIVGSVGGISVVNRPVNGALSRAELAANSGEVFDLNGLPPLDYDQYLARISASSLSEELRKELILPFQTSTGCWWADKVSCSFCGLTPHVSRQMNAATATRHVNDLIDRYGDHFSSFEATDPCMPVEFPQEVFPHINRGGRTILQYEVRANMVRDDMERLPAARVLLPQPGIESLSTRTLKLMRKGVTAFNNVQFLKRSVELGLYPIWNYLYGLPNPEYDELGNQKMLDDIRTLYHLPPPSSNVAISFQRYSEYYNHAEAYGLKLKPIDSYFYVYPLPEPVIHNLAYTFYDAEYFRRLFERHGAFVQEVNLEVVNWMYRFRESIPRLQFAGDCVILDSRGEKPVKYKITATEQKVLRFLDEPRSAQAIVREFGLSEADVEDMLGGFRKARLLFVEEDKQMSVVCETCRLTEDFYSRYYVDFVRKNSTAFQ